MADDKIPLPKRVPGKAKAARDALDKDNPKLRAAVEKLVKDTRASRQNGGKKNGK
jgi:hypothetical protein